MVAFGGEKKTSFSVEIIEHHSYSKTFSLPSALTINTYNSMSYIKLPLTANIKKRSRVQGFLLLSRKVKGFFHEKDYIIKLYSSGNAPSP